MTLRLRLGAEAQRDVADAKAWYLDQAPGLDLRFQEELERTFRQVETFPAGYVIVHRDIRRANLHRFPYAVLYRRRRDHLFVLAVFHHARDPRVWKSRR